MWIWAADLSALTSLYKGDHVISCPTNTQHIQIWLGNIVGHIKTGLCEVYGVCLGTVLPLYRLCPVTSCISSALCAACWSGIAK